MEKQIEERFRAYQQSELARKAAIKAAEEAKAAERAAERARAQRAQAAKQAAERARAAELAAEQERAAEKARFLKEFNKRTVESQNAYYEAREKSRVEAEKQKRQREAREAAEAAKARARAAEKWAAEKDRLVREYEERMERQRYEAYQARAREREKKPFKHWFTGAPYARPSAPDAGQAPPPAAGPSKAYSSPLFGDEWRKYAPNDPPPKPDRPKTSAAYEDWSADMRRERARSAAYEDFFSGRWWSGGARSSAGPSADSAPRPSARPAGGAPRDPPPREPPHRPPPAARTDEWSGAVDNAGVNLQNLTAEDRNAVEELQRKAREAFGQLPTTASGWRKGSFKFHPDKYVLTPVAQKIAEALFKSYSNKHAAWKKAHNLSQKRVRRHVKIAKKGKKAKGARRRSRL
eukprot:jgi/Mesvir1/21629/Mv04051-RA.1